MSPETMEFACGLLLFVATFGVLGGHQLATWLLRRRRGRGQS